MFDYEAYTSLYEYEALFNAAKYYHKLKLPFAT